MYSVDPQQLHFTQDSISNTLLNPWEDWTLDSAVQAIQDGTISADDFPIMEVVTFSYRLWSVNNRRLWVFKNAGVSLVKVKIVSCCCCSTERFHSLIDNKPKMAKVGHLGFWPEVRGRQIYQIPCAIYQHEEDLAGMMSYLAIRK